MNEITEEEYLKNRRRLKVQKYFSYGERYIAKNDIYRGYYINYFNVLKLLTIIYCNINTMKLGIKTQVANMDDTPYEYAKDKSEVISIYKMDLFNIIKKIYNKEFDTLNTFSLTSEIVFRHHDSKYTYETIEQYTIRSTEEKLKLEKKLQLERLNAINKDKQLKRDLRILNKYSKEYNFKIPDELKLINMEE